MADATTGDTFLKVARNVFWSLVPHPLRQPPSAFDADFIQPDRLGYLRDYTFLIYQTNYLFAMGSVGGPLVVWLLVRVWRDRSEVGRAERRFWLMFVPFTALVGIAAHPTPDPYGVAHICGQPLVLLGVTFLAARYLSLPPVARWLGLAGCALDFVLGVLLHFSLQNRVFKFTLTEDHLHIPPSPAHLSTRAVLNAVARQVGNFVFLGDSFVGLSGLITAVLVLTFLVVLGRMAGFLSRPAPHRPPPGARLPE